MNRKLASLLMVSSFFVMSCGKDKVQSSDGKIIGGYFSNNKTYFASVISAYADPKAVSCGAVFIEKDILLTAAHCIATPNIKVRIGFDNQKPEELEVLKVENVIVHPDFRTFSKYESDIAIIKLDRDSVNNAKLPIEPISLNLDVNIPSLLSQNEKVLVVGRGNTTSIGDIYEDKIREITLPVVDLQSCQKAYPKVNESQICAGDFQLGGADSCQGDSGGPLVQNISGRDHVVGVVSFGDGCAQEKKPGVYTRVAFFQGWIKETIQRLRTPVSTISNEFLKTLEKEQCRTSFEKTDMVQSEDMNYLFSATYKYDLQGNYADVSPSELAAIESNSKLSVLCKTKPANLNQDVKISLAEDKTTKVLKVVAKTEQKSMIVAAQKYLDTLDIRCQHTGFKFTTFDGISIVTTNFGRFFSKGVAVDPSYLNNSFANGISCEANAHKVTLLTLKKPGSDKNEYVIKLEGQTFGAESKLLLARDISDPVQAPFSLSLKMFDFSKTGILTISNNTAESLFTWRIDCNQSFVLTDSYGQIYSAILDPKSKKFYYTMHFPVNLNGKILSKEHKNFDITVEKMPFNMQCSINGVESKLEFL